MKTCVHTKICKQIFIAAWFIKANSEQVETTHIYRGMDEHMWYIHTMEYYPAIKKWTFPLGSLQLIKINEKKKRNELLIQHRWHSIKISCLIIWHYTDKPWKHYAERSQPQKTIILLIGIVHNREICRNRD